MENIKCIISLLQKEGKILQGKYKYTFTEQPASYIYKVSIGVRVYYFKQLKLRFSSYNHDLKKQLIVEYEALKKMYPFFKDHDHFNIPKPIFFSMDDLLLVTEEVKGESIVELCNNYCSRYKKNINTHAISVCKRVGEFFNLYHGFESFPYTMKDVDEGLDYIRVRLFDEIFSKVEEDIISTYLERIRSEMNDHIKFYNKSSTHSDVSPCNILFCEDNINVLDFADHTIAHHFQDLIGFKMMLEGQLGSHIKYKQTAKDELLQSFADGYGFDYDKISKDRIYKFCYLKGLSVFIKTFKIRKEESILFRLSPGLIKDVKKHMINYLDYYKTKRKILKLVTD